SVASTASITMNGLERPVKKQRVSPLIPRYYQPLAKRVPGIAGRMVLLEEMDRREVAELLGLACEAVRSNLSKGLRKLRKKLKALRRMPGPGG
ncbi:MAG: hypothetical protein ACLQVM_12125, partial [Terriglobia bacterium]